MPLIHLGVCFPPPGGWQSPSAYSMIPALSAVDTQRRAAWASWPSLFITTSLAWSGGRFIFQPTDLLLKTKVEPFCRLYVRTRSGTDKNTPATHKCLINREVAIIFYSKRHRKGNKAKRRWVATVFHDYESRETTHYYVLSAVRFDVSALTSLIWLQGCFPHYYAPSLAHLATCRPNVAKVWNYLQKTLTSGNYLGSRNSNKIPWKLRRQTDIFSFGFSRLLL